MASTKTRTSIWSSQTLTAGAGNTTATAVDISTGYGAQVNIKLTNGATGPTVAAQVQIQVTNNTAGTLYTNFGGALIGVTTNSGVAQWSVDLPIGVAQFQLVAGSNTGQNVTVDADVSNVTAI